MRRLFLLALSVVVLSVSGSAQAATSKTFTASGDGVQAVLVVDRASATLKIKRAGHVLLYVRDAANPFCQGSSCQFYGYGVKVKDLDGNGSPEVIVDSYSGGAHCCFISDFYRARGQSYASWFRHNWGDPGYRLTRDASGDYLFVTGDDGFAYAYASYAASALPVRVFTVVSKVSHLLNVTIEHPSLIRQDAKRKWTEYRAARSGEVRGFLAAWAADEFAIGRRASALKTLTALAQAGKLRPSAGSPASGLAFVRSLTRVLDKAGYSADYIDVLGRFDGVQAGMSQSQVEALLGRPDWSYPATKGGQASAVYRDVHDLIIDYSGTRAVSVTASAGCFAEGPCLGDPGAARWLVQHYGPQLSVVQAGCNPDLYELDSVALGGQGFIHLASNQGTVSLAPAANASIDFLSLDVASFALTPPCGQP
jgi:hypothetical protein